MPPTLSADNLSLRFLCGIVLFSLLAFLPGSAGATPPNAPPAALLALESSEIERCGINLPCRLPIALWPAEPLPPKVPQAYPQDTILHAAPAWSVYPYDLSGARPAGIISDKEFTFSPSQWERKGDRFVGGLPFKVLGAGDYEVEVIIPNPATKAADRVAAAVLSDSGSVYVGRSIAAIIAALPDAERNALLAVRIKAARAAWKTKLPEIDLDSACRSNVTAPGFSITEAVARCEAATKAFNDAAAEPPFSADLLANYDLVQKTFRKVLTGTLTEEFRVYISDFAVLPYTRLKAVVRSSAPLALVIRQGEAPSRIAPEAAAVCSREVSQGRRPAFACANAMSAVALMDRVTVHISSEKQAFPVHYSLELEEEEEK